MADFDLAIRGGRVATASDAFEADVGIAGGKIAALGSALAPGRREIDARERLVLPGGVDTHCHIEEPDVGAVRSADSFASAASSAAAGGTTTVIPFSTQTKGGTVTQNLRDCHRKAEQALIDYSFHMIVSDPSEAVLAELAGLIEEGHRSLKIFLTYDNIALDDAQTLKLLAIAARWSAFMPRTRRPSPSSPRRSNVQD